MKYINIPPPLALDGATFGLPELIGWCLRTQPQFNESGVPGMLSGLAINTAVKTQKAGVVLALETADYDRLRACLESPRGGVYPLQPAFALLPILRPVLDATDEPPNAERPAS